MISKNEIFGTLKNLFCLKVICISNAVRRPYIKRRCTWQIASPFQMEQPLTCHHNFQNIYLALFLPLPLGEFSTGLMVHLSSHPEGIFCSIYKLNEFLKSPSVHHVLFTQGRLWHCSRWLGFNLLFILNKYKKAKHGYIELKYLC